MIPRPAPFAIVAGALISACWTAALPASQPPPAASRPAEAASKSDSPAAEQFKRPEVVAIAWAARRTPPDSEAQPLVKAWRPDGGEVPAEELTSIRQELPEFGTAGRPEAARMPTLHLVFRIDARARNSQRLAPQLVTAERSLDSEALQEGSSAGGLALSVLTLPEGAIPRWPAEIDVDIRVPNEESNVFQTCKRLDDPLDAAPGLRLFWTTVVSTDQSVQKRLPAVALQVDRNQTALADYDFSTHLKDDTAYSLNALQSNDAHDVRVSPPLDSKDDLDHVDLWRVRYRTERYSRLPIFPERIPK